MSFFKTLVTVIGSAIMGNTASKVVAEVVLGGIVTIERFDVKLIIYIWTLIMVRTVSWCSGANACENSYIHINIIAVPVRLTTLPHKGPSTLHRVVAKDLVIASDKTFSLNHSLCSGFEETSSPLLFMRNLFVTLTPDTPVYYPLRSTTCNGI